MSGKQSLTRNLFGAGKGDAVRPRSVSQVQQAANYSRIFEHCYHCFDRSHNNLKDILVEQDGQQFRAFGCKNCLENIKENSE